MLCPTPSGWCKTALTDLSPHLSIADEVETVGNKKKTDKYAHELVKIIKEIKPIQNKYYLFIQRFKLKNESQNIQGRKYSKTLLKLNIGCGKVKVAALTCYVSL